MCSLRAVVFRVAENCPLWVTWGFTGVPANLHVIGVTVDLLAVTVGGNCDGDL